MTRVSRALLAARMDGRSRRELARTAGAAGAECRRLARRGLLDFRSQRVADVSKHAVPIAGLRLSELSQRRVPWAVVAIEQPAPASAEAIQQPDRPAQRARDMD